MTTTNEKLSPNQAQKMMLALLKAAKAAIDVAASSRASARDRAGALRRLARALSALTPQTK